MPEFAQRSRTAPSPAPHASTASGGALNAAPRVQLLAARAVALGGGQVPVQRNGGDKKGNKKQEKKKAAAEGRKKAKAKKVEKIARSVAGYDTSQASRAQIVEAIGRGKLSKMRAGHLSADSSQKMNSGTRKTITTLTESVKEEKSKARQKARERKQVESDVEEDEDEDEDDFAVESGSDYRPPRDPDNGPPPGGTGIAVQ